MTLVDTIPSDHEALKPRVGMMQTALSWPSTSMFPISIPELLRLLESYISFNFSVFSYAAMRFFTLLPISLLASSVSCQHTFDKLSPDFSWTNITATDELQYHDCGGGFQCARLQLPLDWNATSDSPVYGDKFKMAIVRAPAQVPVTDPRYGGQIILNFGGPGAPGTSFAATYAQALQTSFDAAYSYGSETYVSDHPDARYFDLIFFDPRGIPNSTPWYTPFNNPVQATALTTQISALQLEWPPEYNVRNHPYPVQSQEYNAKADAGVWYAT
jgi:hypothetical protein